MSPKVLLTIFLLGITHVLIGQNYDIRSKLVASDREPGRWFGSDCAIFENYAVVGCQNDRKGLEGDPIRSNAGACYVFKMDVHGIWNEVQKLVASDRDQNHYFGTSVAPPRLDDCSRIPRWKICLHFYNARVWILG